MTFQIEYAGKSILANDYGSYTTLYDTNTHDLITANWTDISVSTLYPDQVNWNTVMYELAFFLWIPKCEAVYTKMSNRPQLLTAPIQNDVLSLSNVAKDYALSYNRSEWATNASSNFSPFSWEVIVDRHLCVQSKFGVVNGSAFPTKLRVEDLRPPSSEYRLLGETFDSGFMTDIMPSSRIGDNGLYLEGVPEKYFLQDIAM